MSNSVLVMFEDDSLGYWQADDSAMRTLAELVAIAVRFESPIVDSVPELRIGTGGVRINFTVPEQLRDAAASGF